MTPFLSVSIDYISFFNCSIYSPLFWLSSSKAKQSSSKEIKPSWFLSIYLKSLDNFWIYLSGIWEAMNVAVIVFNYI